MAHFNAGQSEHADAWVFKLVTDQIRQLALDLVGDAQRTGEIFYIMGPRAKQSRYGLRATSTISYASLDPRPDIVAISPEITLKPALLSCTSSLARFRESSSPV